jgi:hypothetical protein
LFNNHPLQEVCDQENQKIPHIDYMNFHAEDKIEGFPSLRENPKEFQTT